MPWPPLAPRLALLFAAAAAIGADGVASRLHLPSTSANVVTRRYVLSEAADIFDTEADNGYRNESVVLVASHTALVLIDVWDDVDNSSFYATARDDALAENELLRMLPLVAAARTLGFFIIHAPSEGQEWRKIRVLPGEVLVTGINSSTGSSSRCDSVILDSERAIRHVLVAGYDTNKCVVDKPCGIVSLSTQLTAAARGRDTGGPEVILLRDVTRGQYPWLGNAYYGHSASVNMLELGSWLSDTSPTDVATVTSILHHESRSTNYSRWGIRSALLPDLMAAFGLNSSAAQLQPLRFPAPSASQRFPPAGKPCSLVAGGVALVVVSCSSDYLNDGFRARVLENRHMALEPLLAILRGVPAVAHIIHVPNGHDLDGSCAPTPGEFVAETTNAFDAYLVANGITTLFYVGYAANTDMLFGVAGMQRYYADARYLHTPTPTYYWVQEATIAVESAETLGGRWAQKLAMAYRQPLIDPAGNVVSVASVKQAVCAMVPRCGPVLYSLPGVRWFSSPADPITDYDVTGSCGPSLVSEHPGGGDAVTISLTASVATLSMTERKALCLQKSTGTPYAVYQLRLGDTAGGTLLYQTASGTVPGAWTTLTVPGYFTAANVTHRITIVHNGTAVSMFRDNTLMATAKMPLLDYDNAVSLVVGARRVATEYWVGHLGDVLIRNGSYPPTPPPGPGPRGLAAAELAALTEIHGRCNGNEWRYTAGTDAVGGGAPWMIGDPCSAGWFGVKCDAVGEHVTQLFPNTRFSGNSLEGCEIPSSIGNLSSLEHLYLSNDRTPSHLHGKIPATMGLLRRLKCLYLSHTGVSGAIPVELQQLTNLQVFLMRSNNLTGPLIDFSGLRLLRNVWFDTQGLTGSLDSLATLPNLTFLQASNNAGINGSLPAHLCGIDCNAGGTNVDCSAALPANCCRVAGCGKGPKAPPPPPSSMGECFPQ